MNFSPDHEKPQEPMGVEEHDEFERIVGNSYDWAEPVDVTASAVLSVSPILDNEIERILDSARTPDEQVDDILNLYAEHSLVDDEGDPFLTDLGEGPGTSWVDRGIEVGRPEAFYARGVQYARWRVIYSRVGRGIVRAMDGLRSEDHRSGV